MDLKEQLIERLQAFYLTAASVTWASGKLPQSVIDGGEVYTFHQGSLRYTDLYYSGPLGFSGTVTICDTLAKPIPLWQQQYAGGVDARYENTEAVYEFLKEAIRQAYHANRFFGGRGPFKYEHGDFVYNNFAQTSNTWPPDPLASARILPRFERFAGHEIISCINGTSFSPPWVYQCKYSGMLLTDSLP